MFIPISGSDLSASGDFYLSEVVVGDSNPEVCHSTQLFQSRLTRKSKGQRSKLPDVTVCNSNQCPKNIFYR